MLRPFAHAVLPCSYKMTICQAGQQTDRHPGRERASQKHMGHTGCAACISVFPQSYIITYHHIDAISPSAKLEHCQGDAWPNFQSGCFLIAHLNLPKHLKR